MHKRAIVLTVGVLIVVALTGLAPSVLAWSPVNHTTTDADGGNPPLSSYPEPYPYPRAFLPLICSGTICAPVTSVTISGNENEGPGDYTFTTDIDPANATTPITYLWDNGDTTSSSTRNLAIGTHTLVVTATNCGGSVTDDHAITISSSDPDPDPYPSP